MKLFSFTCSAFADDELVALPGFSHRSQAFEVQTTWYPFKEWKVRAYVYAQSRSRAAKMIAHVPFVRDLDGGVKAFAPHCIEADL